MQGDIALSGVIGALSHALDRPGRASRPAARRTAARHRQARDLRPDPDKPGTLTEADFAAIRQHPAYSLQILERAPVFAPIADLAADHHERIDGTGHPRGLAGDDLAMPVRALAVADGSGRSTEPAGRAGDPLAPGVLTVSAGAATLSATAPEPETRPFPPPARILRV